MALTQDANGEDILTYASPINGETASVPVSALLLAIGGPNKGKLIVKGTGNWPAGSEITAEAVSSLSNFSDAVTAVEAIGGE